MMKKLITKIKRMLKIAGEDISCEFSTGLNGKSDISPKGRNGHILPRLLLYEAGPNM